MNAIQPIRGQEFLYKLYNTKIWFKLGNFQVILNFAYFTAENSVENKQTIIMFSLCTDLCEKAFKIVYFNMSRLVYPSKFTLSKISSQIQYLSIFHIEKAIVFIHSHLCFVYTVVLKLTS